MRINSGTVITAGSSLGKSKKKTRVAAVRTTLRTDHRKPHLFVYSTESMLQLNFQLEYCSANSAPGF